MHSLILEHCTKDLLHRCYTFSSTSLPFQYHTELTLCHNRQWHAMQVAYGWQQVLNVHMPVEWISRILNENEILSLHSKEICLSYYSGSNKVEAPTNLCHYQ